jgi:hypothetical protein
MIGKKVMLKPDIFGECTDGLKQLGRLKYFTFFRDIIFTVKDEIIYSELDEMLFVNSIDDDGYELNLYFIKDDCIVVEE